MFDASDGSLDGALDDASAGALDDTSAGNNSRGASSGIITAIIVLFIILLGVYFTTRSLPPAFAFATKCTNDAGCPYPETCDTAAQRCVDAQLPTLLTAAQSAAAALLSALQSAAALFPAYGQHVNALLTCTSNMGVSAVVPGLLSMADDNGKGATNGVNKYIETVLKSSTCNPALPATCGYYTMITSISTNSPAAVIIAAGSAAPSVTAQLDIATSTFSPAASSLQNIVDATLSNINSKSQGMQPDTCTAGALNAVRADISQIYNLEATLKSYANNAQQTGMALYRHFINT